MSDANDHAPEDCDMGMLFDELKALFEKYGIPSAMVHIVLDQSHSATTWFPGCDDDCPHPEVCRAENFTKLAHMILETTNQEADEASDNTHPRYH